MIDEQMISKEKLSLKMDEKGENQKSTSKQNEGKNEIFTTQRTKINHINVNVCTSLTMIF